jgi:hypothetical protein
VLLLLHMPTRLSKTAAKSGDGRKICLQIFHNFGHALCQRFLIGKSVDSFTGSSGLSAGVSSGASQTAVAAIKTFKLFPG